jgi:hypothetical protein
MSTETASKNWKNRGRRPLVTIGPRGQNANRKREAKLLSRIGDYARMKDKPTTNEAKVKGRIENGGFHQPGSYNK